MKLKIIFLFATLFVVSAAVVAFFYYQARTARGLDFSLTTSEVNIRVGVPFEITAKLGNSSRNVLQETMLSVILPEGMVFISTVPDKTIENKTIGSLGSGSATEENFRVVALAGGQSVKHIKASVSYLPTSLGARFEQTAGVDINVTEQGIALDMEVPQKVFSGEEFSVVVKYKNASDEDFNDLRLAAVYPSAFQVISTSLESERSAKDVWALGDLRAGSEGELTIKGRLVGPDNAFYDMKLSLTADFFGGTYVIAENSATISVSPSPLGLILTVNEDPSYIAHPGDSLVYSIAYTNNTEVALKDVIITAKLTGSMFDLSQLQTDGFLSSSNNSIVWNAARVPSLANIAAGESGSVIFRAQVKRDYPITRVGDRNFTLKVNATIESPTVPYFVSAEKTLGQVELISKVAGAIAADAQGFFRDAQSGVVNQGLIPPRVGQPTQYTLHWILRNRSTEMEGITIKAFLGPNVSFTGVAKSNVGTVPTYNSRTQELIWEIPRIAATQGTITDPIEAIFQVSFTPSLDQKGKFATLITQGILDATDAFTEKSFSTTLDAVSTQIPDDSTAAGRGIVE